MNGVVLDWLTAPVPVHRRKSKIFGYGCKLAMIFLILFINFGNNYGVTAFTTYVVGLRYEPKIRHETYRSRPPDAGDFITNIPSFVKHVSYKASPRLGGLRRKKEEKYQARELGLDREKNPVTSRIHPHP